MALWSSQTTHTDISDFSDNPHLKRELRIWRLKIAAVVLAVLAIVGFSAQPAYRAFRESRINKNLEAAKEAARLEDWGTARDRARSVLLARDNDFEAYRIWTRALGKMGEPRTYMAAATLFADERATEADKLEYLRVRAHQVPQAVALSAYASLPAELRDAPDFRAAITPVLVLRGELEIAEKGLREVMGERPSPAVRLELLRALCARPASGRVDEARRIFAGLIAEGAAPEALEALLILGEVPGALAPGPPLPDLPAWISGQPGAQTLHHLLALHPAIDSGEKDVLFLRAINRFLATDPGALGTWLTRHGEAARVATLLEEPAKTRSDAYLARLHALLREGRDSELAETLKEPPESADMVEIEIIRAVMAGRRNDKAAASAAWTRALNHAAFDTTRNRFIEIARAAEEHRASDALGDAWVAAVRSGWGQLPLCRDLLPVFRSLAMKGRSEDLLAMYRTLSRFEQLSPDLRNNANYLSLIHDIQSADDVAREQAGLIADHPDSIEFNSVLMLAEMAAGRPDEAIRCIPQLAECDLVSPMMKSALEGCARVLGGQADEGRRLLERVRWQMFMRQERWFFRRLLVNSRVSGLPLPEMEPETMELDPDRNPAWRKAVERMEQLRAGDVLPALPAPSTPTFPAAE